MSGEYVTIRRFLNPVQAEIARQRLDAEGIPSFLPDSATGHAYPPAQWAAGGVRLIVPVSRVADAEAALNTPGEETCLPDDFVPPPAEPEPVIGSNRLAGVIVWGIGFVLIFPFVLVKLWTWIVPVFFAAAVREGVARESIMLTTAFQYTVATALVFVVIASFWESGRAQNARAREEQETDMHSRENNR